MKAVVAATAAAVVMAVGVVHGDSEPATLPPCEYEDQETACYWDASERGNGVGDDFIVYDGRVWYADGPAVD